MEFNKKNTAGRLIKGVLLLVLGLYAAGGYAQEQRIVIPAGEISVQDVIRAIEEQTELIIGVNHKKFDVTRKVRIEAGQQTAGQLFGRITKGTDHTYIARGNYVILVRQNKQAGAKQETQPEPVAFSMQEGTITLPEEEKTELPEPEVREYKEIGFNDERGLTFYVSDPAPEHSVCVSDIQVGEQDGEVSIDFKVEVGAEAVASRQALKLMPVLKIDTARYELHGFALEGRRHRISQQRRAKSAGQAIAQDSLMTGLQNGDTIRCREVFPASLFTPGAKLVFEFETADCRQEQQAWHTAANDFVTIHREVILPEIPPLLTTGDRISREYGFVEPDPGLDMRILKPEREQALTVYYELDKYDLRFDYRDNNNTLSQMLAAINIIKDSDDSEITYVVLTGYASPEGPVARNERLAGNRGKMLRDFISEHTGLPQKTFIIHNGGSDWEGMELMLRASEEEWRDGVLDIIRNAPQTERMPRIRRMDNGRVYRELQDRFFPELRNAAYIKVYYRNKKDND